MKPPIHDPQYPRVRRYYATHIAKRRAIVRVALCAVVIFAVAVAWSIAWAVIIG